MLGDAAVSHIISFVTFVNIHSYVRVSTDFDAHSHHYFTIWLAYRMSVRLMDLTTLDSF